MNSNLKQASLFKEASLEQNLFSDEEMERMKSERPKQMPELEKMFYASEGFEDVENYYFRKDWPRIRFMFLMYNILPDS